MMNHIYRSILTFFIIFVVGFAAGIAVNKYQNTNIVQGNPLGADVLSKKQEL